MVKSQAGLLIDCKSDMKYMTWSLLKSEIITQGFCVGIKVIRCLFKFFMIHRQFVYRLKCWFNSRSYWQPYDIITCPFTAFSLTFLPVSGTHTDIRFPFFPLKRTLYMLLPLQTSMSLNQRGKFHKQQVWVSYIFTIVVMYQFHLAFQRQVWVICTVSGYCFSQCNLTSAS